ncbi:MAG: hypothetical protein U0457_21760 [Candidatus Sericytochromatia bacterium]
MKKTLLAILFLLLTSNFAYAEENKEESKKEEEISTKSRFALVIPPEIQYSFTDNFDFGLGFKPELNSYDNISDKIEINKIFKNNYFLDIKYSFYRIDNTKFLFTFSNVFLSNSDIKHSLFVGNEIFLNKNVSISLNIGISYSYKKNYTIILNLLDYNFKAYYYF